MAPQEVSPATPRLREPRPAGHRPGPCLRCRPSRRPRRRRCPAWRAQHERRIAVRIRQSRGLLGDHATAEEHGRSRHRVRRRYRVGAQPRGRSRARGQWHRSRLSRSALDRLSVRSGGCGARRHATQYRDHHPSRRPQASGLVHGPPEPEHAAARRGDRRVSLRQRCLQR